MRKKKLLAAVISLALVIAAVLPGTLAVSNGQDSGSTPAETTVPETEGKNTEIPACTCGAVEGEAHKEGCPLHAADSEETKKTCTCGAAEGEAHKEGCPLYAAAGETEKVCTCGAAEGEAHKEGCPLNAAPAAPTEAGEPAETTAPADGDAAPEVLKCTCEPQRGEGELHESTCPLYEGDKHIEGCADDCKDPECKCGCHLFNKIMACTELEDLWNIFYSATEEERAALTDEQFEQIDAKVKSLESVPAMVATMESDLLLTAPSDIETPSRSFTSVAPFLSPVEGAK